MTSENVKEEEKSASSDEESRREPGRPRIYHLLINREISQKQRESISRSLRLLIRKSDREEKELKLARALARISARSCSTVASEVGDENLGDLLKDKASRVLFLIDEEIPEALRERKKVAEEVLSFFRENEKIRRREASEKSRRVAEADARVSRLIGEFEATYKEMTNIADTVTEYLFSRAGLMARFVFYIKTRIWTSRGLWRFLRRKHEASSSSGSRA